MIEGLSLHILQHLGIFDAPPCVRAHTHTLVGAHEAVKDNTTSDRTKDHEQKDAVCVALVH